MPQQESLQQDSKWWGVAWWTIVAVTAALTIFVFKFAPYTP